MSDDEDRHVGELALEIAMQIQEEFDRLAVASEHCHPNEVPWEVFWLEPQRKGDPATLIMIGGTRTVAWAREALGVALQARDEGEL